MGRLRPRSCHALAAREPIGDADALCHPLVAGAASAPELGGYRLTSGVVFDDSAMNGELVVYEGGPPELRAILVAPGVVEVLPDDAGVIYPNVEDGKDAWRSVALDNLEVLKYVFAHPGENINEITEGCGYPRTRMGPVALQLKDAEAEGFITWTSLPEHDHQYRYYTTAKLVRKLGLSVGRVERVALPAAS